ncbi:MAG TPA: hypothetical protein DCZ94_11815 [Lentisphaeria bacterium]|nr:MAG: hypothetical protein A2X48_09585 [Lentisphaerae bacterium GWF2_49_21]HBC87634.1 hypothetical protein [Lentisphaeria bacterium]
MKALKVILLIFLAYALIPYLICPVYKFPAAEKFQGGKIWNPYSQPASSKWYRCNFHLHTRSYAGVTSGKDSAEDAFRAYKMLGYDIASISNYMSISDSSYDKSCFIPAYEHGYGIQKTHHLCIGANRTTWIDFPVYQFKDQKQFIINLLKGDNEIVSLAHPAFAYGYTIDEMKYLTNYDCLEVLNHYRTSEQHWDAALSAGRIAYLEAGDDTHDISKTRQVARCFNMINADSFTREGIVDALKTGRNYGVLFAKLQIRDETYENKAARISKLPSLLRVEVTNGVLEVAVNEEADEIKFIGQDGASRKAAKSTSASSYAIIPEDTYIRTEITFKDGTKFYLNPVFRYSGDKPQGTKPATVDIFRTILYRGLLFCLLIIIVVACIRFQKKRRMKNEALLDVKERGTGMKDA